MPDQSVDAVEAVVNDLTTHQTGFMQASAKNGFMNTSIVNSLGVYSATHGGLIS